MSAFQSPVYAYPGHERRIRTDGFYYQLSTEEMAVAARMAKIRANVNKDAHVTDRRINARRRSEDIDLIGACGEVAAAGFLQVPLNTDQYRFGGDQAAGTADMMLGNLRCEIKTIEFIGGHFYIPQRPADWQVGILVEWIQPPMLYIVGWITRSIWEATKTPAVFQSPVFCIEQTALSPIGQLETLWLDHVKRRA